MAESEGRKMGRKMVEGTAEESAANSWISFFESETPRRQHYGNQWVKRCFNWIHFTRGFCLLVQCKARVPMQGTFRVEMANTFLFMSFPTPAPLMRTGMSTNVFELMSKWIKDRIIEWIGAKGCARDQGYRKEQDTGDLPSRNLQLSK